MIDMQHIGNPADRPIGLRLSPDGLTQCQRRIQRRGGSQEHHVSRDGAGIVVDHGRQPRPNFLAVGVEDQNVELGMIGLPGRVRPLGAMPMDQFVSVTESGFAFMSERQRGRIDLTGD